jgi:hypothetical protein
MPTDVFGPTTAPASSARGGVRSADTVAAALIELTGTSNSGDVQTAARRRVI